MGVHPSINNDGERRKGRKGSQPGAMLTAPTTDSGETRNKVDDT